MRKQNPVVYMDKLPVKGDRISFQQDPDILWKVQLYKTNGKTVIKNLKTRERKVIKVVVKSEEPEPWKHPSAFK